MFCLLPIIRNFMRSRLRYQACVCIGPPSQTCMRRCLVSQSVSDGHTFAPLNRSCISRYEAGTDAYATHTENPSADGLAGETHAKHSYTLHPYCLQLWTGWLLSSNQAVPLGPDMQVRSMRASIPCIISGEFNSLSCVKLFCELKFRWF